MTRAAARLRACPRVASGFTYLGLLIFIAIIGLASAATVRVGKLIERRSAEEQLLTIGAEYRNALLSYARSAPAGQPQYPTSLQDLLKDPRYPMVRRHLRRIYADPLTGRDEWGTIATPDGRGIIGIYSLAPGAPIKVGRFNAEFRLFEGKTSYKEWVFSPLLQAHAPVRIPMIDDRRSEERPDVDTQPNRTINDVRR